MMKKLLTMLAIVSLFTSTMNAQWTNEGAWPDTSYKGGTHGIAVDPDGKVWVASYFKDIPFGPDSVMTSGILVFNPDGTEASFSPITTVATGGGFIVDTLNGNCRGLGVDKDGNILYVQSSSRKMFKINYQTGEGLARADIDEPGSSPTAPSVSDDGTIYVGPVVGGGSTQIAMYDSDLNYIGSAVDGPPAIARTLEISPDGLTLYWMPFTAHKTYVYSRADEFSAFALADSINEGMSIESSAWNPATGKLWISNDSRGGDSTLINCAWYEYDVDTKQLGSVIEWGNPEDGEYPRGIDFSPDGTIAYVGTFSTGTPRMKKAVLGAASTSPITFECDMSVQIKKGNFDPATGALTVSGSFNGWDTGATPMLDADADSVYAVTVDLNPGDSIQFKFVMNDAYESIPNREYVVPFGADTFHAFFDNDEGRTTTEITLSFQVNMEFEIVSQRFNPATDTLSARGSFNGWSGETILTPSVGDPNIYEGTSQYEAFEGDVIYYKYAYITPGGTNWETNPPTGSGNYEYTVSATDISNGFAEAGALRYYNNATLETVVNQESVIRFIVDMNGAKDGNGTAFPSIENVVIAGANPPLQWPDGGWPDVDQDKVIFLYDDGTNGDETAGDNFWTVEVTFPIYSPLDIEYKYGANWGLASNNGANDNEGGVGNNHHIQLFPSFWYGDAVDVFGALETKDVVNGIKELDNGIPDVYSLDQNYPNPFNPSTVINFSIPESGLVTLKIYNVLGQEVAELVNDVKPAGNYEVTFDASDLTSGMYIYTITAGNFTSTKKMMLLK